MKNKGRDGLLDEAKMSSNERRAMLDAIKMSAAMSGKKVKATKSKKTVSPKTKDVESEYYNMARNVRLSLKPKAVHSKPEPKKSLWLGPAVPTDFDRHMKDYVDTGSKEHLDKARKFALSQYVSDSDRLSPEAARINRDKRLRTIEDLEKHHKEPVKKPGLAKRIIDKMKGFRDYLKEEVDATEYVERGSKDFNNDAVRDNVNMLLTKAVSVCSITPYIAFEKVSKILAVFHIHLPKTAFLEGDHGFKTFRLEQFGQVMGMRNDGEVVTKNESPYTLYFEWKQNDRGMFDVFAEIVNDDELKDLLDDVEKDINDDDALTDRDEKLDEEVKSKKTPKLKTNAPVLRAALAKAKTEIASLKAAYKTPNQTKQSPKSMPLSHPAPEPTEFETQPLSKEKEEHIHKFGYLKESPKKKVDEQSSFLGVMPRDYTSKFDIKDRKKKAQWNRERREKQQIYQQHKAFNKTHFGTPEE